MAPKWFDHWSTWAGRLASHRTVPLCTSAAVLVQRSIFMTILRLHARTCYSPVTTLCRFKCVVAELFALPSALVFYKALNARYFSGAVCHTQFDEHASTRCVSVSPASTLIDLAIDYHHVSQGACDGKLCARLLINEHHSVTHTRSEQHPRTGVQRLFA